MSGVKRGEADGTGSLALVLLGALMIFLGCLTYLRFIGGYQQSRRAQHWRVTKGIIDEAWLEETRIEPVDAGSRQRSRGSATTVYHVDFRYAYEVSGVRYVGTRVSMGSRSVGAQELYARFPRGSEVAVFYDPEAPFDSCLIREPVEESFFAVAATGLLFLIIAALFVTIAVRLRRARR